MRIGIDAREFVANGSTGIARYLRDFLEYAVIKRPEHEYILLGNQFTRFPEVAANSNCTQCVRKQRQTIIWDQITLPRMLKQTGAEILLTPYFKAPLCAPCPVALIINDLIPLLYPEYCRGSGFLKRLYFRLLISANIRRAKKLLAISDHARQDTVRFFGIDEAQITVIPLAVASGFRVLEPELGQDTYHRLQLPEKFLLYFGNFNPHKNIAGLLRAYAGLPEALRHEYALVIGGRQNRHFQAIAELVESLSLKKQVFFSGFVEDKDLPALYNAAAAFVFPSFYEGFGLPPLEAMACGTPVICSNAASLPEVVGSAGILFAPDDIQQLQAAMQQVLENPALHKSMRETGLRQAAQFTPARTAETILSVLEKR